MGLFFPVYPPEDVAKLDQQKRAELKTAILQVLQTDPDLQRLLRDELPKVKSLLDVKKMLEGKQPDVKSLLQDKTSDVYRALLGRT